MSGFVAAALFYLKGLILPHISSFTSHKYIWRSTGLLLVDLFIFGGTNTHKVPSVILIIGLMVLALNLYCLLAGILKVARLYGFNIRQRPHFVGSLTAVVVGLLALQSIGQLSARDITVVMPLVGLSYLYSYYAKGNRQRTEI